MKFVVVLWDILVASLKGYKMTDVTLNVVLHVFGRYSLTIFSEAGSG
jgi:hypothetical protein